MAAATLRVPGRTFGVWLREVCQDKKTGKLTLELEGDSRDLYFVAGDLYLSPEHPAYEAATAWLAETRRLTRSESDGETATETRRDPGVPEFRQLAGPIIGLKAATDEMDCTFVSGASQIRLDLAGPLPTRQLLMEAAVWSLDEQGLLRQLGGDDIRLRSCHNPDNEITSVGLEPQEAFLLSRLDPPATVNELINQLDLDRVQVIRSLTRLLAVDLIARVEESSVGDAGGEPRERLLSRFEESIADSLANDPLEIEIEQHRELLRNLLSRMGEMTHFEILTVSPQSSEQDVHNAYFELGRLVHPSHVERLGLKGKEGAFRVLFERATEAYVTISDPDRRVAYIKELGPLAQSLTGGPNEEQRSKEKQEMARQHYERALAMAERQDYHSAIQLLEQAVKADPQTEYLTLLGDCQSENPQWLDRATFSYRWALQVRPDDPSIYTQLGRAYERLGDRFQARRAYEDALAIAPELESARAGLWRVEGGKAPDEEEPTLAQKLLRFFHRDN